MVPICQVLFLQNKMATQPPCINYSIYLLHGRMTAKNFVAEENLTLRIVTATKKNNTILNNIQRRLD